MNCAHLVGLSSSALLLLAACGKESPSPAAKAAAEPAASPPAQTVTSSDPRAAIFLEKGCPQCHTISALAIKSPAEIGPDLTFAYTDVQSRFNMKLEEFLHNPTGTMQIVLSSQIKLSPEERDSVIHILKGIHDAAEKAEKHD
jgi:hypothetical protein